MVSNGDLIGSVMGFTGIPSGNFLQFAIENGSVTVDLPIPNDDFPVLYVNDYQAGYPSNG